MSEIPLSKSGKRAFDIAAAVVQEAGALLTRRSQSIKQVTFKGRGNIVTEVDNESEKLIIGRLLDEFPGLGILAEESGRRTSDSPYAWVIDPLDGTKNYSMGLPFYCVTIALARGSDVLVGATYDPNRQELFQAERGAGAFLNGQPLQISPRETLQSSLIGSDMGYNDALGHYAFRMWDAVWPGMQGLRIMGSSALELAYAAAGRVDIFVHHSLFPWDIATGTLLVREAGGVVTNRSGRTIDFLKDASIIAANRAILQDFLQRTKGMDWRNPPV